MFVTNVDVIQRDIWFSHVLENNEYFEYVYLHVSNTEMIIFLVENLPYVSMIV